MSAIEFVGRLEQGYVAVTVSLRGVELSQELSMGLGQWDQLRDDAERVNPSYIEVISEDARVAARS